ncbi:MAG: WecB/TagA/CpsF family glycosyltransferase [Cyanobacteria bacterium P01_A01_bin.17]
MDRSDILLVDGSGLLWTSCLLGNPLTYNLNGTDLVPALCKAGSQQDLSVYFLGARPGVADAAAANLKKECPDLKVAGIQHGYFHKSEIDTVLKNIRDTKPHLLLVAMGVPAQEVWIDQYADSLPGITCMGVGGLFDFMSENVRRAPLWVRQIGMEWLWRLLMEPKRLWKRYTIGNIVFLMTVFNHVVSSPKTWSHFSIRK